MKKRKKTANVPANVCYLRKIYILVKCIFCNIPYKRKNLNIIEVLCSL